MTAQEMQIITDNAIKDKIAGLVAIMKSNAMSGENSIQGDISEPEISWLERNGYTVERMIFTPQRTISRISW